MIGIFAKERATSAFLAWTAATARIKESTPDKDVGECSSVPSYKVVLKIIDFAKWSERVYEKHPPAKNAPEARQYTQGLRNSVGSHKRHSIVAANNNGIEKRQFAGIRPQAQPRRTQGNQLIFVVSLDPLYAGKAETTVTIEH